MGTETWLITGCSTGFGRDLAKAVLSRGWRAVVTARKLEAIQDLAAGHGDRAAALPLDVTDPAQIAATVQAAEKRFGGIDVLVNNAGYGYQASVEEGQDEAIRALFETNVFGLATLIRAVLPGMRQRRRGTIVNISSVAGFIGFPGSGYYAATKHAVEGLSDSLRKEVGDLTCMSSASSRVHSGPTSPVARSSSSTAGTRNMRRRSMRGCGSSRPAAASSPETRPVPPKRSLAP